MTPNRILESRPLVASDALVLVNPKWLLLAFRLMLLLCGPTLLCLVLLSHSPTPLPAVLLAAVVGTGTFGIAAWHRPWTRFELFIADKEGISFPANDLLVVRLGRTEDTRWLHVPWPNIDNIRTACVRGDETPCVAFDVKVTPDEKVAFFARVDGPTDRLADSKDTVFAAFDINPPAPARTVETLRSLCRKNEA